MSSRLPAPEPEAPIARALPRAGVIAWSVLGILTLAFVIGWVLYQVRNIFPPMVLAVALIFLLNPAVTALERRGLRRGVGTAAIYLLFLLGIALIVALIVPALGRQGQQMIDTFPGFLDSLTARLEGIANRFGQTVDAAAFRQVLERGREGLFQGVGKILEVTRSALHLVLAFVLAPILALYILADLPRLRERFVDHLPPAYREEWLMLLRRCGEAVGGFFRGQLLVASIVGVLSSVGLWIVGIPFWLAIGLLAGFFNIVPLIGPFIGGGIALIVGIVSGGLTKALLAALVMLVVQQLDNHFISPNVMGRAVRLQPVTIILALLAGASLAGLWGMLLAVPGTAVAKILLLHYYTTHVLGRPSPHLEADRGPPENPRTARPEAQVAAEEPESRPEPQVVAQKTETGDPDPDGETAESDEETPDRVSRAGG
ncbi:MAG: AI-2E family transporter [Gaiellales bacterium]